MKTKHNNISYKINNFIITVITNNNNNNITRISINYKQQYK